jgi:hypothetical protein
MDVAKIREHMVVANPADFHWKPKETLPPGAMAANVYGDPTKGNYAFYGKFPRQVHSPSALAHRRLYGCNHQRLNEN